MQTAQEKLAVYREAITELTMLLETNIQVSERLPGLVLKGVFTPEEAQQAEDIALSQIQSLVAQIALYTEAIGELQSLAEASQPSEEEGL